MNQLTRLIVAIFLGFAAATGLMASDRYGYSIEVSSKGTTIVITCRDTDSKIIKDPGFKELSQPLAEVLAGVSDRLPENKTYLVYLRSGQRKIFCHVEEEPVGEHPVIKEFSFSKKQWGDRFINNLFRALVSNGPIAKKAVKVEKSAATEHAESAKIELGAIPGKPSDTWYIYW